MFAALSYFSVIFCFFLYLKGLWVYSPPPQAAILSFLLLFPASSCIPGADAPPLPIYLQVHLSILKALVRCFQHMKSPRVSLHLPFGCMPHNSSITPSVYCSCCSLLACVSHHVHSFHATSLNLHRLFSHLFPPLLIPAYVSHHVHPSNTTWVFSPASSFTDVLDLHYLFPWPIHESSSSSSSIYDEIFVTLFLHSSLNLHHPLPVLIVESVSSLLSFRSLSLLLSPFAYFVPILSELWSSFVSQECFVRRCSHFSPLYSCSYFPSSTALFDITRTAHESLSLEQLLPFDCRFWKHRQPCLWLLLGNRAVPACWTCALAYRMGH